MKAFLLALAFQCPDGSPPPCASVRAPARGPALSVGVLYFDNQSRDSADAYLADGLTEQTIAQLGAVERLTVASRYAVRRFRGSAEQDPAAVGRALNVAYLVTGSVRRAGARLRIGVELVRAGTGVRVWGQQYDRTGSDILAIQDDIASSVATGIVGQLLPAERRAVAARATRSPEAYDHFLRGNFQLARRTAASVRLALRAYQAALAADPTYTDAMARIAYAYGLSLDAEFDIGLPRDTLVARGVQMAERALQGDSLSSEAWLARAYVRMAEYPRTWEGVRERFERALALNPRSAEAHHQFASFLMFMGDTARSAAENRRALELEPGRAITWFQLSNLAVVRREYAEAMRLTDSSLAADPGFAVTHTMRFAISLHLEDTASARQSTQALLGEPTFQPVGAYLGLFLDELSGRAAPARPFLDLVTNMNAGAPPWQVIFGTWTSAMLGHLGHRDLALTILEAIRPRAGRMHDQLRFPMFDLLRSEPRFQALWNETRVPGSLW